MSFYPQWKALFLHHLQFYSSSETKPSFKAAVVDKCEMRSVQLVTSCSHTARSHSILQWTSGSLMLLQSIIPQTIIFFQLNSNSYSSSMIMPPCRKKLLSKVEEMCRPTLSHPTLWRLTGMVNVSQVSASVADLTNALVCWMGANPFNQQVLKSCGKTPRRVGSVITSH